MQREFSEVSWMNSKDFEDMKNSNNETNKQQHKQTWLLLATPPCVQGIQNYNLVESNVCCCNIWAMKNVQPKHRWTSGRSKAWSYSVGIRYRLFGRKPGTTVSDDSATAGAKIISVLLPDNMHHTVGQSFWMTLSSSRVVNLTSSLQ